MTIAPSRPFPGRRRFPLRGKGHRAELNRAILGGAALSGAVVGGLYGRRLLPQRWFRVRPYGRPLFGKVQVVSKKSGASREIDLGRTVGRTGRSAGVHLDEDLPDLVRKVTGPARQFVRDRLGRFAARHGSVWNVLGKSGGRPNLARLLEAAEERALVKAGKASGRVADFFVAPKLPKGAGRAPRRHPTKGYGDPGILWAEKKRVWKEIRPDLLAYRKEFERTANRNLGPRAIREASGRAADQVAKDIAMGRLSLRFPSRLERASRRVFRPVEKRLRALNIRARRRGRAFAKKHSLP